MFTVYHSNRLEVLADQLATLVRQPLDPPFAPETILVQSLGTARWLSLRLRGLPDDDTGVTLHRHHLRQVTGDHLRLRSSLTGSGWASAPAFLRAAGSIVGVG
jgi:hypothetical protein